MALLPKVKLKAVVSFPATVLDGAGIDVVKANGNFTFNIAYDDFAPPVAGLSDPTNQNVLVWNSVTNAYVLVPASAFVSSISPATVVPLVESGVGAVGTAVKYAREDHVHPAFGSVSLNHQPPCGRVTLTSGAAVMSTSVAGATTVYWTPYGGDTIPLFDGTNMAPTQFAEVSQATTDATKSPAAVAASKVYDLFVWNDSGTIRCTRGPAWTNATTRGYTFTMVNGILLNTSSITNGPAASRGTYVGTIASNSGSTIDYIFGTSGSNGVAGVFNVWNAYNRVSVGCVVVDTAAAYTYTSATIRQAHASAAMQVSFVVGFGEDVVTACYLALMTSTNPSGFQTLGLGFDSLTTYSAKAFFQPGATATLTSGISVYSVWNPGIGTHFVAALEASDGLHAATFNSDGAASVDGLSVMIRA